MDRAAESAVQVGASVLLIFPRTATLGAVAFFPILLNIFLITASVGFRGTPVIPLMMLLASTYLLCWDYPRLKAIVFPQPSPMVRTVPVWSDARMLALTATVLVGAGPPLVMITAGWAGAARCWRGCRCSASAR